MDSIQNDITIIEKLNSFLPFIMVIISAIVPFSIIRINRILTYQSSTKRVIEENLKELILLAEKTTVLVQTVTGEKLSESNRDKILNLFTELSNQTKLCSTFIESNTKFRIRKSIRAIDLDSELLKYKKGVTESEFFVTDNFLDNRFELIAIKSKNLFVNIIKKLILEINKQNSILTQILKLKSLSSK